MKFTWTCHICGEKRPDDKISVQKNKRMVGRVPITENVRHCNDREACIEGSKAYSHLSVSMADLEEGAR